MGTWLLAVEAIMFLRASLVNSGVICSESMSTSHHSCVLINTDVKAWHIQMTLRATF